MLTLLVCLLLFGSSAVMGQDVQIKGTVTSSEDGSPIPGAYVLIKGKNTGAATDINGKYTVTVPANATLVFSSIGMKTQEIKVDGQSTIDIVLEPDATEVDEIIVSAVAAGQAHGTAEARVACARRHG
jgi:hypothetical protein